MPLIAVITRKAYGLGAQAMLGGHLKVPVLTLAWPTAELGPMGLEGAVHAASLNVATFAEIDDVIDPADTRTRILQALSAAGR